MGDDPLPIDTAMQRHGDEARQRFQLLALLEPDLDEFLLTKMKLVRAEWSTRESA